MNGLRAIALGLAAASGFLFASQAMAADTEAIGGTGGKAFRAECPAGEFLTGFQLWTGQRINAAAPLCAPSAGEAGLGYGKPQNSYGTTTGASKRVTCAGNFYLSSIKVHQARKNPVNAIELTCRQITDASVLYTECGNTGEPCQGKPVACADGEAATGVHGRSSKGLDAIGLICGPRPTPVAPAPAAESPLDKGWVNGWADFFEDCDDCPQMTKVPAGAFMMGSPESEKGRQSNEGPQHKVTFAKPFAIGSREVTFDQWDRCVAENGCKNKLSDEGWGRGRRPVVNATWHDAQQYVAWLSAKTGRAYRLPSEAEWEYAARAGTTTPYFDGNFIRTDQAKFGNSETVEDGKPIEVKVGTADVNSFSENGFGLSDMHGNVWEWTEDCASPSYAGAPADGTAATSGDCSQRMVRGGAWGLNADMLRSAIRISIPADQSTYNFGFRVATSDTSDGKYANGGRSTLGPPIVRDEAPLPIEATPPAATPSPVTSAGDAPPKPAQWVPPVAETVPFHGEPYLAEAATAGAPPPEPAAESPPPTTAPESPRAGVDEETTSPTRGLQPAPATAPPPPPPSAASAPPKPLQWVPPPVEAVEAPKRLAAKKMAAPVKAAPEPAASPDADGKWRLVPVFFGTDRAQEPNPKRLTYGYNRARKLEIGRALVSVPTSHQAPNVERPWALTIPGTSIKLYEEEEDPSKHFTMRDIKAMTTEEFLKLVKERLKGSKTYKDQALIFIHGYNSSFENAVYRTAQLAHDIDFDGAPFLYSWPSRGELSGYTYDRASNEQAEPFMREFVEMVIKKSGAKSVNVIAHSMGNQLTVRVLQQLKTANVKINQIILAAPDVDRDSFENIAKELKGLSKGITLYAAANDKALIASKTFHGGVARAGDVPATGPVVVEGVDTIDVTTLSTDTLGLNHSTYAEKTALIDDIGRLLKTGTRPPLKRTPALARVPSGKMEYWKFPAQ